MLVGCGPSSSQIAEVRARFAAQEPALTAAEKAFAAAASKRPQPGDGAACGTKFDTADTAAFAERLVAFIALQGSDGPLQASNVTYFTPKAQLDRLESGSVAARRAEQQRLLNRESWYGELDAKKWLAQAEKLAAEPLAPELLIEIGASLDAKPIDKKTFQGGAMLGRAWLYSPTENRFVCAGNVIATSSKSVEIWHWKGSPRSDGNMEIAGDLYMNMMNEAEKSLKAL
jgi:hypothetical protein